jgi:hypothetical protein
MADYGTEVSKLYYAVDPDAPTNDDPDSPQKEKGADTE